MAFSENSEFPRVPISVALPIATTTVLPAGVGRKIAGGSIAVPASSTVVLRGITSNRVYFEASGLGTGSNAPVPSFTSPSEGLEAVADGISHIVLFLADQRPTD